MEAAKKDAPRPVVTFFQPRSQEAVGLYSSIKTPLWKFLPKSNLSKVIIRDNTILQRVQEIKVKHIEESKTKVGNMYDQMKKKFMHDQEKKMTRWKNEYARYQRMLEQIDQRALMKKRTSALEPQVSSFTMWKKTPFKQDRMK
ncbi:uncharacterized protein C5orf52 homolog [Pogona vitticeps]